MNNIARKIIDSMMAGDDQKSNKLFELAMAREVKNQIEDYKTSIGEKIFESIGSIDNSFMPVKKDYTIHAIDTSKKSDRLPEGEPIQYKVNAFSPKTAYKNAIANGHDVVKIVDPSGVEVTTDATHGISEGTINESLKLVSKHGEGKHTAKVYKDHDWGEYRVKFFKDGKHVGESGDYHTDDLDDAKSTADSQIKRYNVNEGTETGVVDAEMTAQRIEQKKQENQERAQEDVKNKAPTINDVVGVLGNTVSVIDTKSVQ